ncbi:MAG TPA: hypothetical protein DDW52_20590 [Planctomycetaceae bacterium]|nr:hypothetical protein [Planctomycetaceae bacterium]
MKHDTTSIMRRMFAGLSEYVFHSKLGVVNPELVDYISELLVRFIRVEGVQKIRKLDGSPVTEIFAMLQEAERRIGEARREVHRHIGDYTLFWSGVYPEALQASKAADQFVSYCEQGKRAYKIASSIDCDNSGNPDIAPNWLLDQISDQFEMCAYGLREVRREWERRDDNEGQTLLL